MNFIRRNLSNCSKEVKESAYLTLVRSCLEYAACVWDPYQLYLKNEIKKVQRKAARWILSDYSRYSYENCKGRLQGSFEYSRAVAECYMNRYATERRLGHPPTFEDMAHIHN